MTPTTYVSLQEAMKSFAVLLVTLAAVVVAIPEAQYRAEFESFVAR